MDFKELHSIIEGLNQYWKESSKNKGTFIVYTNSIPSTFNSSFSECTISLWFVYKDYKYLIFKEIISLQHKDISSFLTIFTTRFIKFTTSALFTTLINKDFKDDTD